MLKFYIKITSRGEIERKLKNLCPIIEYNDKK